MDGRDDTDDLHRWARRRAGQLRNLYAHAGASALLIGLTFLIDLVASRDSTWFHWPTLGLGVLLGVHALLYAAGGGFLDEDWQVRKAAQLARRRQAADV